MKKDLAAGKEAHVFNEDVNLADLEKKVWTEGTYQGNLPRSPEWDRFTYTSPTPIGRRIQAGKPDIPLNTVEIKGKVGKNVWEYHLVPRTRAAR